MRQTLFILCAGGVLSLTGIAHASQSVPVHQVQRNVRQDFRQIHRVHHRGHHHGSRKLMNAPRRWNTQTFRSNGTGSPSLWF